MGKGDLHETRRNNLVMEASIGDIVSDLAGSETLRYVGKQLQNELCPYSILLYPSTEYEESLTSNKPVYFSIAAMLIFIFVTVVFLIYGESPCGFFNPNSSVHLTDLIEKCNSCSYFDRQKSGASTESRVT
jgi:hypothetical protein